MVSLMSRLDAINALLRTHDRYTSAIQRAVGALRGENGAQTDG
jgi:hypothetical protein